MAMGEFGSGESFGVVFIANVEVEDICKII